MNPSGEVCIDKRAGNSYLSTVCGSGCFRPSPFHRLKLLLLQFRTVLRESHAHLFLVSLIHLLVWELEAASMIWLKPLRLLWIKSLELMQGGICRYLSYKIFCIVCWQVYYDVIRRKRSAWIRSDHPCSFSHSYPTTNRSAWFWWTNIQLQIKAFPRGFWSCPVGVFWGKLVPHKAWSTVVIVQHIYDQTLYFFLGTMTIVWILLRETRFDHQLISIWMPVQISRSRTLGRAMK